VLKALGGNLEFSNTFNMSQLDLDLLLYDVTVVAHE